MALELSSTVVAVPAGVIVASVVAYVAQRRSARETLETQRLTLDAQIESSRATLISQRQLAQDDRVWEKRSDLYLAVIPMVENIQIGILDSLERLARLKRIELFNPTPSIDARAAMNALASRDSVMFAFASRQTLNFWQALHRSLANLAEVHELGEIYLRDLDERKKRGTGRWSVEQQKFEVERMVASRNQDLRRALSSLENAATGLNERMRMDLTGPDIPGVVLPRQRRITS